MKLTNKQLEEIEDYIYTFKTKYEGGFLGEEELQVVGYFKNKYPQLDYEKYISIKGINTCGTVIEYIINPNWIKRIFKSKISIIKTLTYHCDVSTAIRCVIESRDINFSEFD